MADKKNFVYKARMANGTFVEGTIKADNQQIVIDDFTKRNIVILEIQEQSALNRDIQIFPKRVKQKEVAQFMRQLATLTDAAIPLTRALDVLKEQATNPTFKEVLSKIRADIDVGLTLATALAKHPKVFTPITISMVRAGEAGGFLTPDVMLSIANNLESDIQLKQGIRSAMTYPVLVAGMVVLIVIGLILFVVPQFAKTFNDLGAPLPVPTKILIGISDALTKGPGLIIFAAMVALIIYLWKRYQFNPKFRRVFEPIKFKMPVFGKLSKKVIMGRFARNFGALIDAGLPIMQIMDVVGETSGSIMVEDAMKDARKYVSVGELISPQLRRHPIFPDLLVEMLSVGEEAGEMPIMLSKIADSYDYEVKTTTDALTSLLEPLLIAFLGVMVGGILIALYLPMFSVYTAIGG